MPLQFDIPITVSGLTDEDLMRLPSDGLKYEVVSGEIATAPAGFEHDVIGAVIIGLLLPSTRGRGFMTIAQAGFRMKNGNLRCPDVSFTLKEHLPDGVPPKGFAQRAPDLPIEIVSPTESEADVFAKIGEYLESGSQEVWILEPTTRSATIYRSASDTRSLGPNDTIASPKLFPGFTAKVSELFDLG